MPEGFSEKTLPPQPAPGPLSEPPTQIHSPGTVAAAAAASVASAASAASAIDDEEAMSEERTRVLSPLDVEPIRAPAPQAPAGGGSPKRTMLGMAPPPLTSDAIQQMGQAAAVAPVIHAAAAPARKPERPSPPSVPESKESATVVKPLEEFLAEAGQRALPQDGAQPGAQAWAPGPHAQTQPPFGQQQGGAQQPGGYGAQQPGGYGAQQPGGHGAQQPGGYGAQQPGGYEQPGGHGAEQPGGYGAEQPGGYGAQQPYGAQQAAGFGVPPAQSGAYGAGASGQYLQQQVPGASGTFGQPGAGYPQAWGTPQPAGQAPGKGPLAIWKAMPFPRKLMFVMLPFGLIAFMIVFSDPPARKRAPGESTSATPDPSASGAPSPSAATSAAPLATGAPPSTGTEPTPSATPPTSPPDLTPDTPPAAPDPAASATAPPLAKGEVTLERKAADFVAANDFAKAAEIYDQLAASNPQNPAYARAAEILRKKAKK